MAERDGASEQPAERLRRTLIAAVAEHFPVMAGDVRVVEER